MPLRPLLSRDASFHFIANASNLPAHWVLIVDWPGLDAIHPVKVTRSMSENTLRRQFRHHVLRCPQCMDKVIHALKNRTLGYDMDYDFLLRMVVNYFKSPASFLVEEGTSFEDFIIKEYCRKIVNAYADSISFPSQFRKAKFKKDVLVQLLSV